MAAPTLPKSRRTRDRLARRLLPDELSASCARLDIVAAGDERLQKEVAMLLLRAYKLGLRDGGSK
jgi:hypothetical protein